MSSTDLSDLPPLTKFAYPQFDRDEPTSSFELGDDNVKIISVMAKTQPYFLYECNLILILSWPCLQSISAVCSINGDCLEDALVLFEEALQVRSTPLSACNTN
jgi:hypothetical protein